MIYVVEVPSRVRGWIGERDGEARSLKDLAASDRRLRCGVKARYTTHETAKSPDVWTVRRAEARRVHREQADAAPAVAQDLLVARNPRTGEVKYFLRYQTHPAAQPPRAGRGAATTAARAGRARN